MSTPGNWISRSRRGIVRTIAHHCGDRHINRPGTLHGLTHGGERTRHVQRGRRIHISPRRINAVIFRVHSEQRG